MAAFPRSIFSSVDFGVSFFSGIEYERTFVTFPFASLRICAGTNDLNKTIIRSADYLPNKSYLRKATFFGSVAPWCSLRSLGMLV